MLLHEDCAISSHINGSLTFGSGGLNNDGTWKHECKECESDYWKRRTKFSITHNLAIIAEETECIPMPNGMIFHVPSGDIYVARKDPK